MTARLDAARPVAGDEPEASAVWKRDDMSETGAQSAESAGVRAHCEACGVDLTPTPEQLRALYRFGNPLRRPPCLETEDGSHRVSDAAVARLGVDEADIARPPNTGGTRGGQPT